jgi:hypothetical protein
VIRARVQHKNKEYALGQFGTREEADAAREAARRVLEALDVKAYDNSQRVTGLRAETLEVLVTKGIFDTQPSLMLSLAEALLRRQKMLSYRQRRTLYPGGLSDEQKRLLAAQVATKDTWL